MSTRSQRVQLFHETTRPDGFEAEWNPQAPNQHQRQAECICLALANFNAIAYDVYANEQESTMVGLKDYSQYQKFVELLNYYYCGAKHFLTKLESSGAGEVEQDQLDRLRKEHEDLNIHIEKVTHDRIFPFEETGDMLRKKLKDIPNEDLFELYLCIELTKISQQQRPRTMRKFLAFNTQIGGSLSCLDFNLAADLTREF